MLDTGMSFIILYLVLPDHPQARQEYNKSEPAVNEDTQGSDFIVSLLR